MGGRGGSDAQVTVLSELGFGIRLTKAFWTEVVSGRETWLTDSLHIPTQSLPLLYVLDAGGMGTEGW